MSLRVQNLHDIVVSNVCADYHHDSIFQSSIPPAAIIKRAGAIWTRRGIKPKQHLSEPRPGAVTVMERRAHADRCENLPVDLPDDMGKSARELLHSRPVADFPYALCLLVSLDLMIEVSNLKLREIKVNHIMIVGERQRASSIASLQDI